MYIFNMCYNDVVNKIHNLWRECKPCPQNTNIHFSDNTLSISKKVCILYIPVSLIDGDVKHIPVMLTPLLVMSGTVITPCSIISDIPGGKEVVIYVPVKNLTEQEQYDESIGNVCNAKHKARFNG